MKQAVRMDDEELDDILSYASEEVTTDGPDGPVTQKMLNYMRLIDTMMSY